MVKMSLLKKQLKLRPRLKYRLLSDETLINIAIKAANQCKLPQLRPRPKL